MVVVVVVVVVVQHTKADHPLLLRASLGGEPRLPRRVRRRDEHDLTLD